MTITAQIIADSISPNNVRLTTMQLRYPRFIHAELMTHRVFSRNASSSRAIPFIRLVKDIIKDTALPIYWGSNKPGMQAGSEINVFKQKLAKFFWQFAMYNAICFAFILYWLGLHKQIVNRILEPWAHINVIVTATEWDNFYKLRMHPDAQPEMRVLAEAMFEAQKNSTPKLLKHGQWHLPYVLESEIKDFIHDFKLLKDLSTARCARVSYLTFEGKAPSIEADTKLCEKLYNADVFHASPFEHQATPDQSYTNPHNDPQNDWSYLNPELHGNFKGWIQNRKQLEKDLYL